MAEEEEGFSGGEEDEEDSGEWTEESEEEEQADHRVMLKPVFVPKNKRATIVQREELEEEEERVAEQEAQRLLQRKEESKVLHAPLPNNLFSMPLSVPPAIQHSPPLQLLLAKELAARSAPKTCVAPHRDAAAVAVISCLRQVQRRVRRRHHHRRRGSTKQTVVFKTKGDHPIYFAIRWMRMGRLSCGRYGS